jgi:DNA recombination protein RmuC
MEYIIGFIVGLIVGLAVYWFVNRLNRKQAIDAFSTLSLQALSKNSEEFLKLAHETLDRQASSGAAELENKKKLIDQTLEEMKVNLKGVETLLTRSSEDRKAQFTEVSTQLKNTAEQTNRLQVTAGKLNDVLASSRVRGQWGERMAEDVLAIAGFIEHINYEKQKTAETATSRPDFTFYLPQNLKVNMDVKFPLDNYIKYVNEETESEKSRLKDQFLRDVKSRIKEVTSREYINPEDNTVDYVLVFIPNEQVYSFINENDRTILDEALKMKVASARPHLYAILAVIRRRSKLPLRANRLENARPLRRFYQTVEQVQALDGQDGRKLREATRIRYPRHPPYQCPRTPPRKDSAVEGEKDLRGEYG